MMDSIWFGEFLVGYIGFSIELYLGRFIIEEWRVYLFEEKIVKI